MRLLSFTILTVSLIVAFVYGILSSIHKKKPLFFNLVTWAVGCMLLGELFFFTVYFCFGALPSGFNIGMLGVAGCYFFLLSASFGQIDGLGDDRNPARRKYRLIPIVFPIMIMGLYVLDLFSKASIGVKIINGIMLVPIAFTSYYNFKHLIIPDVDYGIFQSMRKYNALVLFISILSIADILLRDFGCDLALNIVTIILSLAFLLILPITAKGVQRWFK
ncbi:MAG: hypothetical protein ACI4E1_05005 [Lachnospira sp.]